MDARDPERPQIDAGYAGDIISSLYALSGSLQELPSERDQNFHLVTETRDEYVLKISTISEKRETLDLQVSALKYLAGKSKSPISSTVQKTTSGEEIAQIETPEGNSHFVRLISYLPGKVMSSVKPHSPNLLNDFGRFVGILSKSLAGFNHPAAHRDFYWDLGKASSTIANFKEHIPEQDKRELVDYYLDMYQTIVVPQMVVLRKSIIHNDTNDDNVVIDNPHDDDGRIFGILDFGDMVYSHTINELAIAISYAMLDKDDPIGTAQKIISGYHSVFPITEQEIELLFPLACTRLATSVSVSAYQKTLEPDNEYLIISEARAWELLTRLAEVHPRFAAYCFRQAAGFEPCPNSQRVTEWVMKNTDQFTSPIGTPISESNSTVIDLSVGSIDVKSPHYLANHLSFEGLVSEQISKAGVKIGIGRYNEPRLIYSGDQYLSSGGESRTVHIATDLFVERNTPIYSIHDGVIHSFQDNARPYDNGPTIVVEYKTDPDGPPFYVLYSHLTRDSLSGLFAGKEVKKGEQLGRVGEYPDNGGWPPHLHFQLIVDMMGQKGDLFGVAPPSKLDVWLSICPDPNLILQIPDSLFPESPLTSEEILKIRKIHIGPSLSVSYRTPIKIVRGYMQYLYDENGQQYLDMRNNVPHVGHSNPRIVKVLSRQSLVLNTNTRYLHDNLVKYAQRLTSKFPAKLSVCYFVNSGSEANELALRLARTHTRQKDIIAIDGAYHGNTRELINISSYKHDGPGGEGAPPYVHVVRMPNPYRGEFKGFKTGKKYAEDILEVTKSLEEQGRGLAAFICEPLMGCGGQIVFPDGYLKNAFKYVRKAGGVCIVDEVQVGFGRMGTHFWGFETQSVVPDIVTLGKPIGNGHPIGAVITTPEIAESFTTGMEFFSTTGGNTVSCAVGMAVLDEIENQHLQKNALEVGNYLKERLIDMQKTFKIIGDVRGHGLFIGVELVLNSETLEPAEKEAHYIIQRMKDLRILVSLDGPHSNILKIKPPMVFTKQNADSFVDSLAIILNEDPVSRRADDSTGTSTDTSGV
ncbi:MAG: aminotransferase class III-fold pyridoxal phosphate-dependent enzyme [Candidatus Thorarchaeota archaeon]